MIQTLGLLVGGLVLLTVGAELLVRAASALARRLGISSLVVGLTIVAFGTSSPEAAVSVESALRGEPDIALGNVVGSNIFNILFILGVSAAIAPVVVDRKLVRVDVPLMILASGAVLVLGWDGRVSRPEGIGLFAGVLVYLLVLLRGARRPGEGRTPPEEGEEVNGVEGSGGAAGLGPGGAEGSGPGLGATVLQAFLILLGLGLLVTGSHLLVEGGVALAGTLGMSELVVGLTVVAAGTSLPEVAASVAASLKGMGDLAVGNVVGSNLFNTLFVLGGAGAVAPTGIRVSPAALTFDIPVMTAVALACLPIFFTGYVISRLEGWVFLFYFAAYLTFVILDRSGHGAAPVFGGFMLLFVIPITAFALGTLSLRQARDGDGALRQQEDSP